MYRIFALIFKNNKSLWVREKIYSFPSRIKYKPERSFFMGTAVQQPGETLLTKMTRDDLHALFE